MYNFVDTIEHTSEAILPAEAMSFNGEYIENLIDGYRTLYVKGRDTLSPEIEIGEVGVRDGAYLKNKRFPARIITIGYQLLAETNTAFRSKFNALNDLLNTEDAELIFADEDDKYFIGTVQGFGDVPEGRNSITSEFEIICTDPFKYSITEYEVEPTLDSGATFSVDYGGTYPAYPTLEADFYQSDEEDNADGECGFVAFINQSGKVLQFGKPDETDTIAETVKEITTETSTTYGKMTQAKQLLTEQFNAVGNWNNAGYMTMDTYVRAGSLKCAVLGTGTDKAMQANSYGATTNPQWHGPTACKTIGNPPAVSGASNPTRSGNFTAKFNARICTNKNTTTAKNQAGSLQAFVLDNDGSPICGCQIWKSSGKDKGSIKVYVRGHGAVKVWNNIDLSYYNKYFGYQKKGGAKPNLYVTLKKTGGKFEFNIAGLTYTYTDKALASRVAKKISFYMAQWGNKPALERLGVYSCSFTDNAVQYTVPTTTTTENISYLTNIIDVVNTFGTNDVLIADCQSATVRLQSASEETESEEQALGNERPDLGALGNDWEQFTLVQGENEITTMYSDWVANEYKPTFKLRYRERFL